MDPNFAPIHGISLERYAELGAAIADVHDDAAKVRAAVEAEGVSASDFEAAKAGWTARMQDMALMGRVATAYMPLYQAALAKRKGGRAQASYESFVAVSAAIKVFGYEVALQACRVKGSDWTEISGHWTRTMGERMMQFAGHASAIAEEEARLRAGGAPREIAMERVSEPAGGLGSTLPSQGQMPTAHPFAAAAQNPAYAQAMAAQAQVMQNPIGFGFAQAAAFLSGGVVPGASVVVVHPGDGQRYPGRVLSTAPQQTLVQFSNGAQQWLPSNAVVRA